MIKNKKDYFYYLSEDRKAAGIKRKFSFFGNELWKYTRVMRKYEYYCNCKKTKLLIARQFIWLFTSHAVIKVAQKH